MKRKTEKRKPRAVAYLRVSLASMDIEKNKADILRFANERDLGRVEWVEEKVSGVIHWRVRAIGKIIETLQEGDCIVVSEVSRLGRSLLEILEILSVAKRKGICIYDIKNNWALNGGLQAEILATVLSICAAVERELISARTKEALAARKASGLPMGRPKGPGKSKLDQYRPEIEALLACRSPKTYIAARYGSSVANLSFYLKRRRIGVESRKAG